MIIIIIKIIIIIIIIIIRITRAVAPADDSWQWSSPLFCSSPPSLPSSCHVGWWGGGVGVRGKGWLVWEGGGVG